MRSKRGKTMRAGILEVGPQHSKCICIYLPNKFLFIIQALLKSISLKCFPDRPKVPGILKARCMQRIFALSALCYKKCLCLSPVILHSLRTSKFSFSLYPRVGLCGRQEGRNRLRSKEEACPRSSSESGSRTQAS